MEKIIPKVDRSLIKKELNDLRFVRKTNYGKREIYIITHHNAPNVMREIGRLRELSFRDAKGGTGKELDIDVYDTSPNPFKQLIVWDPEDEEIIGGYRFIDCNDLTVDTDGTVHSPTGKLFNFSPRFIKDYMPHTIELGRSFVQPSYQASYNIRKGMFSLDNLWDGLGALVVDNPHVKYFFGKMTMYPHYSPEAKQLLLSFLHRFFPDPDHLVVPHAHCAVNVADSGVAEIFTGSSYEENYRLLNKAIRDFKENIPPLFNAYMNLSPTMRTLGTAVNNVFGAVEETGIIITISDVYETKKKRHLATYLKGRIKLSNIKLKIRKPK
jgi:hypothetical protein